MQPIIVDIPLPFEILGHDHFPIRAFGLMVVLALLAGNAVALRLARKKGIDEDFMGNLFLVFTLAAIVGARAFYVITNLAEFDADWASVFYLHQGGMVYYGSFICCFIATTLYVRRAKQPLFEVLDCYAAAAPLGMAIGRVGCLLVGDDYGKPCSENFFFKIMFSTRDKAGEFLFFEIPADNGNLCALAGQWLHPAQVYMSLNALLLFGLLWWFRRQTRRPGEVVAAFFMLYALSRSVIELFRGDEDRGFVGPLSTSQFVSIFVFLFGLGLMIWIRRRPQSSKPN